MNSKIHEVIRIIDENPILHTIFKSCPYEILHYWDIKKYPAGATICRQGEVFECFVVLVKGFTNVYFMGENGKRYNVATHQCGAIIGEMEFFEKKPFVCSVEAYTDITVLEIKRDYFLKWVTEDRNISSYIIGILSKKFCEHSQKTGTDILYPLKVRICSYLLSRCKQLSKNTTDIEIKVNKEKLSEELAVTSRSIHRVLHNLQSKDIIQVKTDVIIIKDLKKLAVEEETTRYDN